MTEIYPIENVERRVLRAIRTLGVLHDREANWLRVKACWPATLVEWSDLLAQAENPDLEARPARFEPTRSDLGDYLTALSWFAKLRPPPLRLVRGRRVKQRDDHVLEFFYVQSLKRPRLGLTTDQRIIHQVAYEWSFEAIGREIGQHHDAIRNRYRKAIQQCWRYANADAFAAARSRAEQSFRPQARAQAGSRAPGRR